MNNKEINKQDQFYNRFDLTSKINISNNTDGILGGILFEHKLKITNLSKVLYQCVNYLVNLRIKGQDVPAHILITSLEEETCYLFKSKPYMKHVNSSEYKKSPSKINIINKIFVNDKTYKKYENIYNNKKQAYIKLYQLFRREIKNPSYEISSIDEHNIVGLSNRYHLEVSKSSKTSFLDEIREPKHFKYINPYTIINNDKFKHIMDLLNDKELQKDMGAFYTPFQYSKLAADLVYRAVMTLNKGQKYIIVDRCSGTGSLLEPLEKLIDKNGNSLLSNVVASTYEYHEWVILHDLFNDRVKEIYPSKESAFKQSKAHNGKIETSNVLMNKSGISPDLLKYVKDNNIVKIVLENPPYRDVTAENKKGKDNKTREKSKFKLKEEIKQAGVKGAKTNDISTSFIWSAFNKLNADKIILLSPIKYCKMGNYNKELGIDNYNFVQGFGFNRKHFHASPALISCIYWDKKVIYNDNQKEVKDIFNDHIDLFNGLTIDENTLYKGYVEGLNKIKGKFKNTIPKEELILYDINKNGKLKKEDQTLNIHKTYKLLSNLYDHFIKNNKDISTTYSKTNGETIKNGKFTTKSYNNENIIAYLETTGSNIAAQGVGLIRYTSYRGNGFHITKDNYFKKLPLFVTRHIILKNWYEKDFVKTSSDQGLDFEKDEDFLLKCLIFTTFSSKSRIIGGVNHLSYWENTEAYNKINSFELNKDEQDIIKKWKIIQKLIKETANYKKNVTYGLYQIITQLNTVFKDLNGVKQYKYEELNSHIIDLNILMRSYHHLYIKPKLYQYDLLK